MFFDSTGSANTELMARGVGRHLADIACNDFHRIATVTHQQGVAVGGFRGGAVDDSDEVTCDDETVLAFLLGVLGDLVLLDDGHRGERFSMRDGRIVAMDENRKAF